MHPAQSLAVGPRRPVCAGHEWYECGPDAGRRVINATWTADSYTGWVWNLSGPVKWPLSERDGHRNVCPMLLATGASWPNPVLWPTQAIVARTSWPNFR